MDYFDRIPDVRARLQSLMTDKCINMGISESRCRLNGGCDGLCPRFTECLDSIMDIMTEVYVSSLLDDD